MGVEIIKAAAESRRPAALVTIIETRGSVPRHPGSKMLVGAEGAVLGTVGGGKGEILAIEAARRCLEKKESDTLMVEMQGAGALGQAPVCGGSARMLVELIADPALYREAGRLLGEGKRALMLRRLAGLAGGKPRRVEVTLLDESGNMLGGDRFAFDSDRAARCLRSAKAFFSEEEGLFYDPVFPNERLLILGGGHVGQAIANFAVNLDFEVTVVDEREEFAAPGRFPAGVRCIRGGYTKAIEEFPFDAATYAIIVTHGHLHDLECVRAVLKRNYRYAGCIGSARKVRLLLEQLKHEGGEEAKVEGLFSPIGLDIAAETPAEIAVAILGEMIAVRRSARNLPAVSISRRARQGGSG